MLPRLILSPMILLAALLASATIAETAPTPPQAGIASANALATDAGHQILAAGGNAFDATVAIAAVLGVVEPESSGFGGGGFFLLHVAKDNRQLMVDARETAPIQATRDMYLDADGKPVREASINGPLAAGIPGQPAGLVHLAQNYGRLPLAQSLAPAIKLAREGFPFGRKNHTMMGWRVKTIATSPAAAAVFLRDGQSPQIGDLITQPDLARTLERLAEHGHAGFYAGETAAALVEGTRAAGGVWQLQDLANYKIVERAPLRTRYGAYEVVTASPPSSGGVALATIFNILDGYPREQRQGLTGTHLLIEAMRRAYRDRALYLGDPDFVEVPTEMLLHPYYAAGLRASIRLDQATPSASLPGIDSEPVGEDTTHFSIIDTEGNLVAATLSVNLPYGSAFMPPGTGVLLNNEMDDFSLKAGVPNAYGLVGEDANAIAPGKRPLSSMTPSFLLGPERSIVIGTPGGSRIITMVLQGALTLVDGGSAADAVARRRIHHQYLPDVVSAEPDALDAASTAALGEMGHVISPNERDWGNMHVVVWNRQQNTVEAASDPRWQDVGKAEVR